MAATSNQTSSSSPWQVCLACLLILFLVPVVNKLPLLFYFIVGKVYKLFGWNYRKTETTPPASKISDILDSSSSSSSSGHWDVFLSFRGEDIRKTFVDHLYTALDRAGIQTFKDDPKLRKGEEISSALLNAIQDSRMSIVVFSKNYASSRWCLAELEKIVECKRTKGQTVYPVFYDVDPSDVRYQRGSFAEAIEKHKLRFTDKMIEIWRDALTEASNLSGYNLKNDFDGYESKLIKNIVNNVSREVKPKALNVDKHLVGVDSHVADVYEKISIGSSNLCVVGIHGMGGVGKTTIAKAFYNKYLHCFERHCFLENVRENSQNHGGPLSLVQQLVSALLEKQDFSTVDEGISILKERVRTKKVLIVLDDLDESGQSKLLVSCWNFFCLESRIIITTRDTRMLVEFEKIDEGYMVVPYMVKTLGKYKSLELFSYHAFRGKDFREILERIVSETNMEDFREILERIVRGTISEDFIEIFERIVSYARGLPLALKVLGSLLYDRTKKEWTSTLKNLQQNPNNTIQQVLKISYDALDSKQKQVFLDAALFFYGMDKEEANQILDSPDMEITVLEERCLLTIDQKNKFRMHDLILDMAKEIVRQESSQPKKRSRLWDPTEVHYVFKKRKGTKKIEGIRLDITPPWPEYFDAKTFESMPNLRLLQIDNLHLTGSFENSFEELRWLRWRYCPLTCLPPSFHAPELVSLDMQYINVNTLWEDPKHLKSLKFLNASDTPIERLPDSIGHMASLVKLFLTNCERLKSLPSSICNLSSLKELHLDDCDKLEGLPAELGNMKSLRRLIVDFTAIEQLPDSVGHLSLLVSLELGCCNNLRSLPSSICNLSLLKELHLDDCDRLEGLPAELGNIKSLVKLFLTNCNNLKSLPSSICNLSSLEELQLHDGNKLEGLPAELGNMKSLVKLFLTNCNNLKSLPNSICNLNLVEELRLDDCDKLEGLPAELGNMKSLVMLFLTNCNNLKSLPNSICNLSSLEELRLDDCDKLEGLPTELGNMKSLRKLILTNCKGLSSSICNLSSLEELQVHGKELKGLVAELGNMKSLERLSLTNCNNLRSLPSSIFNLSSLKVINLYYLTREGGTGSLSQLYVEGGLPKYRDIENRFLCSSPECIKSKSKWRVQEGFRILSHRTWRLGRQRRPVRPTFIGRPCFEFNIIRR